MTPAEFEADYWAGVNHEQLPSSTNVETASAAQGLAMTTRALRRIETLTAQLSALSAERERPSPEHRPPAPLGSRSPSRSGPVLRPPTAAIAGSATATRPAPSGTNARSRSESQQSLHFRLHSDPPDGAY